MLCQLGLVIGAWNMEGDGRVWKEMDLYGILLILFGIQTDELSRE